MTSPAKKHAKIEHIEVFGLKARLSPAAFHVYAAYYLQSAQAASPGIAGYNPARYYLACRTIELCLKAFLSLKGYSMKRLSTGVFGHDLKALIDEVQKKGLSDVVKLSNEHLANIERASIYYHEKVFEYPAIFEAVQAYPGVPNCELLLDGAEKLVEALRDPCLAAE
jgi:hypothetical protein